MRNPWNYVKIIAILLVFGPSWLPCHRAWGQASVNVPVFDPVYRDIDKLVAHGLVDKIIMGQRPFSRREVARIVKEAMLHFSRLKDPLQDPATSPKRKERLQSRVDYLEPIFARLQRDYQEELVQLGALEGEKSWYSLHPLSQVEADITVADSPSEALPPSNGIGIIDANINPLLNNRQGRRLVDGSNLSLETTHWFRATDYFALLVKPRFQLGIGRNGAPDENRADVLNLYGKFWLKNIELEIGRDNLLWGQGQNAGLLLSNNPRGLDQAKLSNDSPFIFPWVFKYLGAQKFSFFYSDLGPEQNFPHAYLVGLKWSLQPLSFFELSAFLLSQSGGQGSPPASFGNRVEDVLLPFVHGGFLEISNRLAGFDGRFRIPPLRGAEFYFEAVYDDGIGPSFRKLWQDAGYEFGLYIPRVTQSGSVDFRVDYQRTGLRFYRHGQFVSGWTLNKNIIGNNLGPNAYGIYSTANWDVNPENLLTFHVDFENRSADIWGVNGITNSDGQFEIQGRFFKVIDNPDERRYRLAAEWLHRLPKDVLWLKLGLGYERVQNFNFLAGNDRNNFLGQVNLQLNLDSWTRFTANSRH